MQNLVLHNYCGQQQQRQPPETVALVGDLSADVVIVGARFMGLSAVLRLAGARQSVVVVESNVIGWGASGRNGGQINPAFYVLPSGIWAHYGKARGNRLLALLDSACDLVFNLIKRHGIQCAHPRVPYLRGAYGKRGISEVKRWVQE